MTFLQADSFCEDVYLKAVLLIQFFGKHLPGFLWARKMPRSRRNGQLLRRTGKERPGAQAQN